MNRLCQRNGRLNLTYLVGDAGAERMTALASSANESQPGVYSKVISTRASSKGVKSTDTTSF
jgi:hypothetical protein